MAMPPMVVKIDKKGIRYESSCDKASYTIKELSRAALKNVAKVMKYKMKTEAMNSPSLQMLKAHSGRFSKIFGSWVRPIEGDLQIGMKANTWYGVEGELGTANQPTRGILQKTVFENIDLIRIIEGQYLSAINADNVASGLIDEAESFGEGDDI